jgi:hypothetical protein
MWKRIKKTNWESMILPITKLDNETFIEEFFKISNETIEIKGPLWWYTLELISRIKQWIDKRNNKFLDSFENLSYLELRKILLLINRSFLINKEVKKKEENILTEDIKNKENTIWDFRQTLTKVSQYIMELLNKKK